MRTPNLKNPSSNHCNNNGTNRNVLEPYAVRVLRRLFAATKTAVGPLSMHQDFHKTSEAQFDEIVNVHFKGVYFLTQRLLPLMNDGGRIVNISSGLARIALPGSSAYGAAKGAVEVLTRYLAKELGPRRITANVVAPGAIQTDFSGGVVRDNPEVNKHVAEITALGRAGVPDDIGPMIASLLSDENRWVNGQRIEVSGGMAL